MISSQARETLLGPLVVGSAFGVVAALATYGFVGEYGPHIYASSEWSLTTIAVAQALLAFLCVAGGTVMLLGVLPLVVSRIASWLRTRNMAKPNHAFESGPPSAAAQRER